MVAGLIHSKMNQYSVDKNYEMKQKQLFLIPLKLFQVIGAVQYSLATVDILNPFISAAYEAYGTSCIL